MLLIVEKLQDPGQGPVTCFTRGNLGQCSSACISRRLGGGSTRFSLDALASQGRGLFTCGQRRLTVSSRLLGQPVCLAVLGQNLLQGVGLRILQAALVYINTLMLQDVLAEDAWADMLTTEDRRGLTPLFWQHVLPYGEVKLDMTARLSIRTAGPAGNP
jgi:hypothetical protein